MPIAKSSEVTNRKNLLHKEPSVINDEMIIEALDARLPNTELGKYARLDGINPRKATFLLLEYKNVSQIANISHMLNLTKLQLCNNIISKIENLDALVNLTYLDLSFNSIRKIENLQSLRKLECLNLHRNLITEIAGLDNQLRLEILVISCNGIDDLGQIKYLRRLVRLESVNLDGNPISTDPNFRVYSIGLLPQLRFLDYVRVSFDERREAEGQYAQLLEKLAVLDDKNRRRASVVEAQEEVDKVYSEAFVDGFYEDQFWERIFQQDPEGQEFLKMEELEDARIMFLELFRRASQDLFEKGMANFNLRDSERQAFETSLKSEKSRVQEVSQKLTEDFIQWTKDSIRNMRGWASLIDETERRAGPVKEDKMVPEVKAKLAMYQSRLNSCVIEYASHLHQVWYQVMSQEMGLHEQIMDVSQELTHAHQNHIADWLEQLRSHFGMLRDIQMQLNERLVDQLLTYPNFKITDPSIPETIKHLLEDKEALTAALQQSHENHIAFIDASEEHMVAALKKWLDSSAVELTRDEVERNRLRVSEISHFADYYRKLLDDKRITQFVTCTIPDVRGDQTVEDEEQEEFSDNRFSLTNIPDDVKDALQQLKNLQVEDESRRKSSTDSTFAGSRRPSNASRAPSTKRVTIQQQESAVNLEEKEEELEVVNSADALGG